MSTALRVRVAHQISGRTRLLCIGDRGPEALDACARRIAASGLARAEVRARSGSIVLTHTRPWPELAPVLETAGLRVLPAPPRDPIGKVNNAVVQLNDALAGASGGRMDLANAAFLGLIGAGLVQLARGQVVGPALTLFSQALTLALLQAKANGH